MSVFSKTISIRWADLDPNFHLRHSAYYDLGAQFRLELLENAGLSMKTMKAQGFGPILFREECIFKKEILMTDEIVLTAKLLKMRNDASRWTIIHEFIKADNTVCTQLTIDGAWMDIVKRKIADPTPPVAVEVMNLFPKAPDFIFI